MLVPVIDLVGTPLQPANSAKVRKWIKEKRCTKHFHRGVFYIKLKKIVNVPKTDIILGIDTGSKRTAFTIASKKDIILNWMIDSTNFTKEKIQKRRMYRLQRRQRKTPYRKHKFNRSSICKKGKLAPSTRSRWNRHLRLIYSLLKILPINKIIIEDICTKTHNSKLKRKKDRNYVSQWNIMFMPLQVGKNYFYNALEDNGIAVYKRKGWQTFNHRKKHNYIKIKNKLSTKWESQCIDSHSLCEMYYNKKIKVNYNLNFIKFINFSRRELFVTRNDKRIRNGSTRTLGYNRGTLIYCSYIKHKKNNIDPIGLCYLGGYHKKKNEYVISLHDLYGNRIGTEFKISDCVLLTNMRYISIFIRNHLRCITHG